MPKSKPRHKKNNKPKPIKWKSDQELFQVPANPRPTIEFPRPDISSRMEFTCVPSFPPNHPQSQISRSRFGDKGIYDIRYFLSIPGVSVFKDKIDFRQFEKSGDSLVQLPIGQHLIAKSKDVFGETEIQFLGNAKGILSQVRLRVECNSFEDAERYSHDRIATVLSYWSFLFDVAIEMSDYLIIEETTGTRKYSVGLVGKVKPFDNDSPFDLPPEHQRILAAYREAMNSSNLFYQLLCFFKVTEGIIALRQKEIKKVRPLTKGEQGFESNERFPNNIDELNVNNELNKMVFSELLGKGFQEVRDKIKDEFRHAIAHLVKFETVIDGDRFDDISKCVKAIIVIKFIARKMLENDLNKLSKKNQ